MQQEKVFMRLRYLIIFIICNACTPLTKSDEGENKLEVVDIKSAFNKNEKIKLSEIAGSIEYVPLETKEESIISRNPRFFVDGNFIIVVSFRQVLVFDRKTGKFIREISGRGKGPEEYNYTITYDPVRGVVKCMSYNKKVMEYDIDGTLVRRTAYPNYYNVSGNHIEMRPDLYATYITNARGDIDKKILVFDQEGKEEYVISNYNYYSREDPEVVAYFSNEAEFYNYDSKTYFKEMWSDTLFQLADSLLIPRMIFDAGELGVEYPIRGKADAFDKVKELFKVEYLIETDRNLFFTVNYQDRRHAGYYDKQREEIKVSNYQTSADNGFKDDLNGITDFIPFTLNQDRELVGFVTADVMIDHISRNPGEIPDKMKGLEIDHNPVVTIAKVKD